MSEHTDEAEPRPPSQLAAYAEQQPGETEDERNLRWQRDRADSIYLGWTSGRVGAHDSICVERDANQVCIRVVLTWGQSLVPWYRSYIQSVLRRHFALATEAPADAIVVVVCKSWCDCDNPIIAGTCVQKR